jgi:hypothetical protein
MVSQMSHLLAREEVAGHDLVYGKLLIGDKGGLKKFLDDYTRLPKVMLVPHHEVVEFVRGRHLAGRGIDWVGAHLLGL